MAAGVTTREIIKMLLEKRHKVTVIVPSTYAVNDLKKKYCNEVSLGVASTVVPCWLARRSKFASMLVSTFGHLSVFVTGLHIIRKHGPFNVILAQYHTTHIAPLTSFFFCRLMKVPLVIKIHDFVPGSPTEKKMELIYATILSKLNRVALSHACLVLSGSSEFSRMLVDHSKVSASKITLFPNTVSLNPSSTTAFAEQIRNRLNLNGKKVVLFVGETVRRGLEVLLKAMAVIKDPSLVVLVIGTYSRRHVELAEKLEIRDRVFFLGEISHEQVAHYISMADICIGPLTSASYTYGCVPRKVLEYMVQGRPVVIAENTVTRDLAIDKVSAIIVNSNDEVQVARAISRLLSDDMLSTTLGKNAQEIVASGFSSEELGEKLDRIFIRICTAEIDGHTQLLRGNSI